MQSLTQPELLLKPFAESGDKNTIPVNNNDEENPQLADLTNGFPEITSEDPDDGGLPPERKDINGLGYLTTTYDYFYQAGGTFTFNPTISTAIGGYPLGARLWYTDNNGATTILRSTIANNTDNFNDGSETGIGTSWVPEIPALGWNNTWNGDNNFRLINIKADFVLGTTPTENKNVSYGTIDNNNDWMGGLQYDYLTNGSFIWTIGVRRQDKSNNYATFSIGYDSSQNEVALASAGVKSNIVRWGRPNYASQTEITNGYVCQSNGFIIANNVTAAYQSIVDIYINNVSVASAQHTTTWVENINACYPVSIGDTITYSGLAGGTIKFCPCL